MKRILSLMICMLLIFSNIQYSFAASSVTSSINASSKVVSVSGNIELGAGKKVYIQILDPKGNIEYINVVDCGMDGAFRISYTTRNNEEGIYKVTIGYDGMSSELQNTFDYKKATTTPVGGVVGPVGGVVAPVGVAGAVGAQDNSAVTTEGKIVQKASEALNTLIGNPITQENVGKVLENLNQISTIIVNNEMSAKEVSENIQVATTTIKNMINKADDSSVKLELAKQVTSLIDSLNKHSQKAISERVIIDVVNSMTKALSTASEIMNVVKSEDTNKSLIEKTKESVSAISNIIGFVKTEEKLIEIVNNTIDSSSKITGKTTDEKSKVMEEALQSVMVKLAEKTLNKIGNEAVSAEMTGQVSLSKISDEQYNKLLNKMNNIVTKTQGLEQKLQDNNIKGNLQSKLSLEISNNADAKEVQLQLPASLVEAAKSKGLEMLEMNSGLSTVSIPTNVLAVKDIKNVKISVKSVDKDKELSADLKALVGDAKVLNFNITVDKTSGGIEKITDFSKPVNVKIPYTLKYGENPDKVTVYYIDDKGNLKNLSAKYDVDAGTVSFSTNHFSMYMAKNNDIIFGDVSLNHWSKSYIEAMAAKGIINGKGENVYCPDQTITRAEFAKLIVNALNLLDTTATSEFRDVLEKDWYYSYVSTAIKKGIIKGYEDGTFKPNDNVSRQDMAVMVYRALKAYSIKAPSRADEMLDFTDKVDISDYSKEAVATAIKYEIIGGMPGNIFAPTENATRAQAAKIIYKIFNIVN